MTKNRVALCSDSTNDGNGRGKGSAELAAFCCLTFHLVTNYRRGSGGSNFWELTLISEGGRGKGEWGGGKGRGFGVVAQLAFEWGIL